MDQIILVTGATGRQGGAVARHLLRQGWVVRVLTRKPTSDEALMLLRQGAQLFRGDMNDSVSVRKVLKGVYGVFAVFDWWENGVEKEVQQGRILIEEARIAGVNHFVYSSICGASRLTGIPHFESKWQIEQLLHISGLTSTILRPVYFMENLLDPEMLLLLENGILSLGISSRKPLQMIAADDIGMFAAEVFDFPDHYAGCEEDIAGDVLTGQQMAAILGRELGRAIEYRKIPVEKGRMQRYEYVMMVEWLDRVGFDVDVNALRNARPELNKFDTWTHYHRNKLREESVCAGSRTVVWP